MTHERTCLDIFSGLACFSIAARANGVRTVAMCEIKSDCRNFLAAQWPGVTLHDNAKTLDATKYRGVWLVCGGPPCQPASVAGEQRGAADHRWLWPQAVRIVRDARPAWFLFENPPGIKSVGLDGVLADLEAEGYEVRTLNIPACAVDSPQRRERLWIVGHTKDHARRLVQWHRWEENPHAGGSPKSGAMGHATQQSERVPDLQALPDTRGDTRGASMPATECGTLAGISGDRCDGEVQPEPTEQEGRHCADQHLQDSSLASTQSEPSGRDEPGRGSQGRDADGRLAQDGTLADGLCSGQPAMRSGGQIVPDAVSLWQPAAWIECGDGKRRRSKPGVCGLAHGPSVGLLEALGNAIVWPIAARIIAAMIQAEEAAKP